MQKTVLLFLSILLFGCAEVKVDESVVLTFEPTGEMLFEGSNSLQATASGSMDVIASEIELDPASIESISIKEATVVMTDQEASMAESLVLQIVSDNNEMKTLGTLNPLPDGNSFQLTLGEDTDLLPYFRDSGNTWVLDVNLNQDYMEEISVEVSVNLIVEYTPKAASI